VPPFFSFISLLFTLTGPVPALLELV